MPQVVQGIDRRVHVVHPHDWAEAAATDYWANFGSIVGIPGNAIGDLDLYGWATTGFTHTVGSVAGLLDSSDAGTTGGINLGGVSDNIRSPFIFGDYAHGQLAAGMLGYDPTVLNFECYARFAVSTNNEEETGFGFIEAGAAAPVVKAGEMAFISSDGTNFSLESGAAVAVGDVVDDTSPHLWRVSATLGGSISWYIDGVLQGNTLAIQANLWPVSWAASTKAATGANDPVISWVHIWYS